MPDIFDEIATSTATKEPKDIFDTIEYKRDIFDEITDEPEAEAIPQYQSMAGEFMKALERGGYRTAAGLTGTAAEGVQFDRPYTRLMDLGAAEVPKEPSKPLAIVPVLQAEAAKLYTKSEQTHLQPGQTATKGEAVKSFIANAVGETLPFMSAATLATLTTGTPMAAFGVAFAVEGDNAYRDAIKAGATEDEANLERLVVGSINGAIEQMQIGGIFRFAKRGKGAIKTVAKAAKDRALKKLVKAGGKFGAETVRHAVTEGLEEALQETVSMAAPAMHGRDVPEAGEFVKRAGQAGLGGMVAGTFLGGGGALLTRGEQKTEGGEFEQLEDDLTKVIMDSTDMDEATARETARAAIEEKYYRGEQPELPEGSVLATAFGDKNKHRAERQQLIERQEAEAAALDEEVTEIQKAAMKEAETGASLAAAEQAERKPSSAMIERRQAEIARSEEAAVAEKPAKPLAEQALTAEKEEYTMAEKPAKKAEKAATVPELQAAIDEMQESRISRAGKGTYKVTYSDGSSEEKAMTAGEARKVRNKIHKANQLYEEEAGGLSRQRRNQHIRDVEERIKKNDLYQTQLEADEIRGGQIGTGFYYVGKHMTGELKHALEGEPAELRKMFTTDPDAGASNWDVIVQEALLTESEEGEADTSGYMDVEEFIDRVKEAYYNEKGIKRGISERALGRAEQMQAGAEYKDAELDMIIEKRRMLKAGEGAEAIDDMIRNWAENFGIDEELIAAEFVGAEPKKLKDIKQVEDPAERERQLDLLAEQQILEEEWQDARKAVKEVLAENEIEVETRMVSEIKTETKRDLLGTPFNEGHRGKTKGFGFDLTAAEAQTNIKPKLEEAIISELNKQKAPTTWQQMLVKLQKKPTWTNLFNNYMKPAAEMKSAWATAIKGGELGLAFEGRGQATGVAIITPAGKEIVLLAYGADSATGYHEGYHILRRRLSRTDIRVLEIKYEDEEAEAAAFGEYVKGNKKAAKTPMIRGIWNKLLKILERIKNALAGRGYATAEDIFGGLAEGTRAMEAQPVRGFGTKYELTNEQGRRDVMRRAAINARKARLKKRAGMTKKGPKIKRIKIKIDEAATPYLKEELTPDTALPAAKVIEFKKTGGVKNQRLSKKFYEESIKGRSFREARRELREKTSAEGSRIWTGLERFFAASSTRLNNISPELFRKTRKYVYNVMTRSAAMMKDIEPFLKATKKMSGADQKILDLAFKNGDERQIDKLIAKYNLTEQYETARDVLDDIYEAAKEVGMDIGYRKDYWHRSLKDPVGFLEYFQKGDDWSIIKEAIKKRAKQAGRTIEELTPAERAQVVNTLLRGYRTQAVALGTPGAAKERTVELIDRNINKFYHDFRTSIVEYIRMMNGKIAEREFFGRETKEIVQLRKTQSARLTRLIKLKRRQGLKEGATEPRYKEHISTTMENWQAGQERLIRLQNKPLEDTIGGLVDLMVANEDIRPSQEKQIRDILQGIFDPKRMGSRMGLVATAIYIDTLNSPLQAITQLEEFGLAFYRSPVRFIPAAVRSFLRRSKITPRDIGIVSIGEEFYGASMQKSLAVLLKSIGFEQIDRLGKETYINAVLNKYRSAAKKGRTKPWLIQRLTKVFGAQYKQVLEDLRGGEISDNVKYLLFNELLDIQPVAISEMPETYNKAGKWRILYTLKTFLIRRMDFVRNECIKDMKSKKTFLRGFGKLIWLAFSLGLFGAGADALKDLIRGKPFDLADSVVDNLLRLAMFSKYQAWKTTEKGLGTAVTEGWRPPTKVIDAASRDIYNAAKGKDRGFELWRSFPVVGEEYYWWFGEGRRKVEWKKGKKKKTQTNIFD